MSKKLLKILEEIKSGTRKDIEDVNLTPKKYLIKDENGVSFLEHLLKNNIKIPYKEEYKFGNNIEIGYIYCKYGKDLYSFDFSEEQLFSTINGKLFIEFIAEKEKLSRQIIQKVKNHIELVEIMIFSNNVFLLDDLSQELVEKLMTKYPNGLYPMEKYLVTERVYEHLLPLITDYDKLIEICTKYNKIDWLKYAGPNALMYKINENETLLHSLINKENIIPNVLNDLPNDIQFINFLRKNNFYEYLNNTTEDILLLKIDSNKTLLEDLLEKGYIPKIKGWVWEEETVKILNRFNKLELLNEITVYDDLLLKSPKEVLNINNGYYRTFLEYMLDNGYNPVNKHYSIDNPEIIKILYNKGYYKILGEKLSEKGFLYEIEPGISIIDKLLEKNINININFFNSTEFAKKLYELKRFDLLVKGDIKVLLNFCDSNNTYLDLVLEHIKERDIKYNLNNFRNRCSDEFMAKFYILIAKHDMMQYIDKLEEEDLLNKYNKKTLLEELLDLDPDLTFNKILTNNAKSKLKISVILKSRGLNPQNVDVITEEPDFTKEYLDNIKSTLGIGPLYQEGEYLLKQLEKLFMYDGKSDPELISALVSCYKDGLINNYEINIQELRKLIEIKTEKMDSFFYIKKENSGYFDSSDGSIYCDDAIISNLLHETGHALHYYSSNFKVPDEYNEIVERTRKNPETINKVEEYSKKFNELRKKIGLVVEENYDKKLSLNENKEEIIKFLNKTKDEKKEELKSLEISDEILDIILDNVFTPEKYFLHQKRIFKNENVEAILRSEFGAYVSIGDIIDAIYDGDLHSGNLKNKEGEEIESTYGHGLSYYYARNHGFDEMIANFCMILKSKDSKQVLNLLKDIVGDELYNLLWEFYNKNIVNSSEIQKLL